MSLDVRRDGVGFTDSLSFDFVDLDGGAAGLVRVVAHAAEGRTEAAGLVIGPDGTTAFAPSLEGDALDDWGSLELGGVRVADDGERARVTFEADEMGFEIALARLGGAAFEPDSAFSEASGLAQEVSAARVNGEWRAGGSADRFDTLGRIVRSSGALDWTGIELIRSLSAVLEDGSVLGVAAARPAGAAGHGEEAVSAMLLDPEGSLTRFEEPLLSTQYDSEGSLRRAGLELWGPDEDAPALRGAGTPIRSGTDTAFLRFKLDGTPGTARYDLVRGA